MRVIPLLLSVLALSSAVVGYRILIITPTPSRSHSTLAKGIVDPLLEAGHQVTWGAPFTDWKPHKNLKIIDLSVMLTLIKDIDMTKRAGDHAFVKQFAANISALTAAHEGLRETLVKDSYDAVVTEWFFSDTDACNGTNLGPFAAVQQVPWIMLCGMVLNPHIEAYMDDVKSVSTVPMVFHDFTVPMSFFERVVNTFTYLMMTFEQLLERSSVVSKYEAWFGPLAAARGSTLPPFGEAVNNVSVLFVNSHPSIAPALSLPPNVVDIGGYHIGKTEPLPQEIQQILDSSPQGVVYFSMGSVLKSAILPLSLRKELIAMLGALPYTVLWKFEEELTGLPKNIVVKKWWPQSGVLAHPNVKLFITHGGMLSTLEAVHYGVPLLAIPVFGDQPSNAARAVRSGYALKVPYSDTMGPELKKTLAEILSNDSYYKQAKYLSKIFNNRPVAPSKLITHYIELAIESKGAYHLRSKSHLYAWYQRWCLDQLAVLLVVFFAIISSIRRLCTLRKGKNKKVKKN